MKMNKKAQIAIFVIIALVIVGGIVAYFAVRGKIFVSEVPAELAPVFDFYESCVKDEARTAIDLAGSQGGYVSPENYILGTEYAPFGNQLNFLGVGVPYWFYISRNGLFVENILTKTEIEGQIMDYLDERISANCDFRGFYEKGYSITLGEVKTDVSISDNKITIDADSELAVSNGESSAVKSAFTIDVESKFGTLYNTAKGIYDFQKKNAIFENYSVDVLRNYAPVDGVEIGCAPKIWKTRDVVNELQNALEANINSLKFQGNYYTLTDEKKKYFVVNYPVQQQINILHSKNWPMKLEIEGADNELMIAEPIGQEAGMGVMGFCYSPYHFVYSFSIPVLVQVIDGNEMLQFPVVAIVDKNLPREGIGGELAGEEEQDDVCKFNTQDVKISVYDTNLNLIDANLSFICFSQRCELGETNNGVFIGKAPACFNGQILARAGGYAEKKELFSSNEEFASQIIMDREYDVDVELEVGGRVLSGEAVVSFNGARSASASLPANSKMKLSEGLYNASVYVYGSSSIEIPASKSRKCVTIKRGGIAGFFGATEEKCFDIDIPATKIDKALVGGGKGEIYLLPSDLEDGKIKLRVDALAAPNSIDDLSRNYEDFDGMGVELAYE